MINTNEIVFKVMGNPSEADIVYSRSRDEEEAQARVALFKAAEGEDADEKVHISSKMVSSESSAGNRKFLYIAACAG